MNYQKIYNSLIERARSRVLEAGIYFEKHHVLPRCLGGSDDFENIVKLTAEEHYIAHQLLVKLNPDHHGLISAAIKMRGNPYAKLPNNKTFGWLRRRHANAMSKRVVSEETRKKVGEFHKGKIVSEETRRKQSEAAKNRKFSEETRLKLSLAAKNSSKVKEHLENLADSQRGRQRKPFSEETKKKMSDSAKNRRLREKEENVICV